MSAVSKQPPKRPRIARKPVETDLGFSWGIVNTVLLGVGLAALVGGYVALGKGSTTLAPVLLVAGYCVFVPASLLVRGGSAESGE
jgi:hypothetical protein